MLLAAFAWIIVLAFIVHRYGEVPLQRWLKARLAKGLLREHALTTQPANLPPAATTSSLP